MAQVKKGVFKPKVETKLRREDFLRVDGLAKVEGKTKSEVVREAVLHYLEYKEQKRNEARDQAIAAEIEAMTNRICAMLARQGRHIATVFELTYTNMSRTKGGAAEFDAAATRANQKMARHVQKEEREMVEAIKKAVKG